MSQYAVMPYTDYENACDAVRSKTGGNSPINSAQLASEISGIQVGGAEITDGIVVTVRNASGYATEVDHYGNAVETYQFGSGGAQAFGFRYLESIILHGASSIAAYAFSYCSGANGFVIGNADTVRTLGTRAFYECKISSAVFPNVSSVGESCFRAANALTTVSLPKLTVVPRYAFYSLPALESMQLGSIGYRVTSIHAQSFISVSQASFSILIYTAGSYVDTALANVRNGAASAVIVIKASEDTSYGGVTYNAGDTIITSEVST